MFFFLTLNKKSNIIFELITSTENPLGKVRGKTLVTMSYRFLLNKVIALSIKEQSNNGLSAEILTNDLQSS